MNLRATVTSVRLLHTFSLSKTSLKLMESGYSCRYNTYKYIKHTVYRGSKWKK